MGSLNLVRWQTLVIPTLRRWSHEDQKFEAILRYIASLGPTSLKKKKEKKKKKDVGEPKIQLIESACLVYMRS